MFRESKEPYPQDPVEKRLPQLNPAFKLAVSLGVLASIRLHVSRQDALDARDESGQTLLMIAAKKNRAEACHLLLEAGADRSLVDLNGRTALDLALEAGAQETVAVFALHARGGQSPSVAEPVGLRDEKDATLEALPLPPSATTNTALEESDDGLWTPLEEKPPPDDSPELREIAWAAHAKMSAHRPKDASAAQWDDVSGYLPTDVDISGIPIEVEEGLREIVLTGIREGEIRSSWLSKLLTEVDTSAPDSLSRLTVQMLNDLGIEVDETYSPNDEWSNSRQSALFSATDAEAELQDEALQYLKSLLQGRNEPSRLFSKEGYVHPLLSQESEVRLAQLMEQHVDAAIECLSEWPSGLRSLLASCEEVKRGIRSLGSIRSVKSSEAEGAEDETDENEDLALTPSQHKHDAVDDENTSDAVEESSDHLDEFIMLVASLEKLVDFSIEVTPAVSPKVRQILFQMRLAGAFLSSLSDPTDTTPAAKGFASNTNKFLEARDQLVLSNLKLVVQLAKRYARPGIDYLDLLQEGHIGLIRAVDRFDWRRGFKFSTMATWWIRQQVQRAAPELGLQIRLPVHAVEKSWLMKRYQREFEEEHGHAPTIAWVAERMDMPVRKVEPVLRCISEPVSLDDLEKHKWLVEVQESDPVEVAHTSESNVRAEKLLQVLGANKDRRMAEKVLRMRYGVGVHHELTLDEIGRRYGLTRERIRQIEIKGIKLARIHLGLQSSRGAAGERDDDLELPKAGDSPSGTSKIDELHVKPMSSRKPRTSTPVGELQNSTTKQAAGGKSFSANQTELLYKAKAAGLQVMTYKEAAQYITLVMLTQSETPLLKGLAEELLQAGFQYKPGNGYWV